MRRLLRSFGPTALAAFLAFVPLTGAFAEDAEFDNADTDGSQIEPAGADPAPQYSAKNLNTVPEDGMGSDSAKGPDGLLVRQLLAARPNEDLVICVAGCFSGRDRVVYAQPAEKPARAPTIAPQSSLTGSQKNLSSVQQADGVTKVSKAASAEPQVTASQNPHAPIILNPAN